MEVGKKKEEIARETGEVLIVVQRGPPPFRCADPIHPVSLSLLLFLSPFPSCSLPLHFVSWRSSGGLLLFPERVVIV